MKTRVNLYLPEFKPPKEILTLTRVILITLAVLAVMIAWTVYSRDQLAQQQRKNQELTDRQITLSDEVLQIQQRIAARNSSEELATMLERAKQRYEAKLRLAGVLASMKEGTDARYSALLMAIAQVSSSRMAIESITANGRTVSIKGKTTDAAAVAEFLDSFKRLEALRGLSFESVEVKAPEEGSGLMSFSLSGRAPDKTPDPVDDKERLRKLGIYPDNLEKVTADDGDAGSDGGKKGDQ